MARRVLQTSDGGYVETAAPAPKLGARRARNAAIKEGIRECQDLLIEQIKREKALESIGLEADTALARKYGIGGQP